MLYILNFANVYNSGAYGAATYGGTAVTAQAGGSSGSGAAATGGATVGGTLSNTGFDILLVGSIACFLIFMAVIVRLWHRPAADKSTTSDHDLSA